MRSHDLRYGIGRTARIAVAALGLGGLLGLTLLTVAGFTHGGGQDGVGAGMKGDKARGAAFIPGIGQDGSGGGAAPAAPVEHARAKDSGVAAGPGDGRDAFGMDRSGVAASFESLSPRQQARVMQRCKDVLAQPAQAAANHLTLCHALSTMGGR